MHELPQPNPDGSYQLGPTCPLRLTKDTKDGTRRVYSPSNLNELWDAWDESVVMSRLPDIPETIRFSLADRVAPGQKPFIRDLLYTRAGERRLITMTGYLMSAPRIEVVRTFTDAEKAKFSKELRSDIELAETIEMEHVQGFDAAVARHRERVSALEVTPADMREAQRVYDAILYGH